MPTDPTDRLFRSKRGTAILIAAVVQTLNESDRTFQTRFLETVAKAYRKLKDGHFEGPVNEELELLSWTRDFLTGFDLIEGQKKPFFED